MWEYENSEHRDHVRSSWAPYPNTCNLLSDLYLLDHEPTPPPSYQSVIERFAMEWSKVYPLPYDYNSSDAQPTSVEDRLYSKKRGAGDGLVIEGVIPISLRGEQFMDPADAMEKYTDTEDGLHVMRVDDILTINFII